MQANFVCNATERSSLNLQEMMTTKWKWSRNKLMMMNKWTSKIMKVKRNQIKKNKTMKEMKPLTKVKMRKVVEMRSRERHQDHQIVLQSQLPNHHHVQNHDQHRGPDRLRDQSQDRNLNQLPGLDHHQDQDLDPSHDHVQGPKVNHKVVRVHLQGQNRVRVLVQGQDQGQLLDLDQSLVGDRIVNKCLMIFYNLTLQLFKKYPTVYFTFPGFCRFRLYFTVCIKIDKLNCINKYLVK
uniref:Uncharacterized protein n=1 Tax=Photinus pyralis TaxID=7054 RepID=A0A1Y1M028_PHOPY